MGGSMADWRQTWYWLHVYQKATGSGLWHWAKLNQKKPHTLLPQWHPSYNKATLIWIRPHLPIVPLPTSLWGEFSFKSPHSTPWSPKTSHYIIMQNVFSPTSKVPHSLSQSQQCLKPQILSLFWDSRNFLTVVPYEIKIKSQITYFQHIKAQEIHYCFKT